MKEIAKAWGLFGEFRKHDGHRFAVIEGNRDCNRRCSYCTVPQQYKREQEATVAETTQIIDWLDAQGYHLVSWVGGEPLAPIETKEGITFFEHTIRVVEYAAQKGIAINVTTNGDYLTSDKVSQLAEAGLDSLTLSLHTYTRASLEHLISGAKLAAGQRILPVIQAVLSTKTVDVLPAIAATAAQNGVFFSFGVIQEKGGGFSTAPAERSLVPSREKQELALQALSQLKAFGFVRNNTNYLKASDDFYPNNWTCDPERDTFIHIGAGGLLDICSDVRTSIPIAEIPLLSESEQWRQIKRTRVANCGNCLFHCYYEAQNPDLRRDLATVALAMLIKTGNAKIVERLGKIAVKKVKASARSANWDLRLYG